MKRSNQMKKFNLSEWLEEVSRRTAPKQNLFICDTEDVANYYRVPMGTTIIEKAIPQVIIEDSKNHGRKSSSKESVK